MTESSESLDNFSSRATRKPRYKVFTLTASSIMRRVIKKKEKEI
jgi:hypothetical protein